MIQAAEKQEIINVVMKNGKGFRASKPKVDKTKPITGRIAFVWRMVGFMVSPNSRHWCMPVTAEFDLCDEDWNNRKEVIEDLNVIVNEIVDSVPKEKRYGVNRWGKALGYW